MATKKGRRGPDIRKYVLTVDARSGQILHTEIEDPVTRERKVVRDVTFAYGIGGDPGNKATGLGNIAPATRYNRPVIEAKINPLILPAPPMKKRK